MSLDRSVTEEALVELRDALGNLEGQRDAMPHAGLVALAGINLPGDLTVDFRTRESLGFPIVVVRPSADPVLESLTPREMEVAIAVADGLANKEIAVRLSISAATVKDHVHRILEKTALPNRAAIAAAVHPR